SIAPLIPPSIAPDIIIAACRPLTISAGLAGAGPLAEAAAVASSIADAASAMVPIRICRLLRDGAATLAVGQRQHQRPGDRRNQQREQQDAQLHPAKAPAPCRAAPGP